MEFEEHSCFLAGYRAVKTVQFALEFVKFNKFLRLFWAQFFLFRYLPSFYKYFEFLDKCTRQKETCQNLLQCSQRLCNFSFLGKKRQNTRKSLFCAKYTDIFFLYCCNHVELKQYRISDVVKRFSYINVNIHIIFE